MPGEPLLVLVTIENEYGRTITFECADNWLICQDLNEGDEWPEDIDSIELEGIKQDNMSIWMDNYYKAIEDLDD